MGVINITPNSFSDGGSTFSLDSFLERWDNLIDQKVSILDIGAESTAPFNNPVDEKEEQARFEKMFFPLLGTLKFPSIISIDTYRPAVFKFVYKEVKKILPGQKFIWNDVSGILDETLWETLNSCPDAHYVFGHTLVADREDVSNHMGNVLAGDPILKLREHFRDGLEAFLKKGMEKRVIFDPLFGFSKTLDQNWELIKKLPFLIKEFGVGQRWLLGISKKSFLQKKLPESLSNVEALNYSEYLHSMILSRWMHQLNDYHLILRVHDPIVVSISASFIENGL